MNPGKAVSIYNIPKLVKTAYYETFTPKNVKSGFSTPGIWPLNELAFSDDDFAPTGVYTSGNLESTPLNTPEQSLCNSQTTPNLYDPQTSGAPTTPHHQKQFDLTQQL